jgi:hypothetical protein
VVLHCPVVILLIIIVIIAFNIENCRFILSALTPCLLRTAGVRLNTETVNCMFFNPFKFSPMARLVQSASSQAHTPPPLLWPPVKVHSYVSLRWPQLRRAVLQTVRHASVTCALVSRRLGTHCASVVWVLLSLTLSLLMSYIYHVPHR